MVQCGDFGHPYEFSVRLCPAFKGWQLQAAKCITCVFWKKAMWLAFGSHMTSAVEATVNTWGCGIPVLCRTWRSTSDGSAFSALRRSQICDLSLKLMQMFFAASVWEKYCSLISLILMCFRLGGSCSGRMLLYALEAIPTNFSLAS